MEALIRPDIINAIRLSTVYTGSRPVNLDYWPSPAVNFECVKLPGRTGFSMKLGRFVLFVNRDRVNDAVTLGLAVPGNRVYFMTDYEPAAGHPMGYFAVPLSRGKRWHLWRIGK